MIESLIDLFSQLEPDQGQESIDSSWDQFKMLCKNKSIIQPFIQIYDDSTNPYHKFLSLTGINACLVNSFIHFNQTELFLICSKIVDMYLNEQELYFKIMISEIICYLMDHIKQSWEDLDHLIFQSQPSQPNYMKMLFHYLMISPNAELILLKVQQCFNFDLKIQLEGFEILLFFIEDKKKNYYSFSKKIQDMVNHVFVMNDVSCFNIFCQLFNKFFLKVYSFCNIYAFLSNMNNYELNPAILILIRDFVNNNLFQMLSIQYQIDIKEIEDKDQYFADVVIDIFTKEVALSNYLYSIEIDEMTTTSENFSPLINSVPKELVETTIRELASSNEKPSICTAIPLISSYIEIYGGNEEIYHFFGAFIATGEPIITKMAIDALYELKDQLKQYYQPSLIEFLINWTIELKNDQFSNQFFIHFSITYISKFIQEFGDISPFVSEIFNFALKILNDGIEIEIIDILLLINFSISCCKQKNDELLNQLIGIVIQLIDQSSCDEIIYLSYAILVSILLTDKNLIEPFVDTILLNLKTIYALKFISIILAFYQEKVEVVIKQNLQKIIELCNCEVNDPFKILTAFQIEVTIFSFYKAKVDFSASVFNLFFLAIQNSTSNLHESIKIAATTLFQCLHNNVDIFDPNSVSPYLLKLLGETVQTDKLIIDIVLLIINIYNEPGKFYLSPFLDYIIGQTESIFQSGKADLFESSLICFTGFLDVAIELSDDDIIKKIMQVAYTFLNDKNQIIRMVCLKIFLNCQQKVNLQDENIIESIIHMINEQDGENKDSDLSNEIACAASNFVVLMMEKNPELLSKYLQLVINSSLKKLKCSNDKELSENLIFILINLENCYKDNEELYQEIVFSILTHFSIKINVSLFECCYVWLIKKLDSLPEELKLAAFQSIVVFITCDIRQFYEDGNISGQLLDALFSIALSLPKQLISESLDNDKSLVLVYLSHMNYIKSELKKP